MHIFIEAENGRELLDHLRICPPEQLPNVIILDLNMPEMNGSSTAEHLKVEFPQIYILVLSMHTNQQMVVDMLKLGVRGYVNKNVSSEELLSAIRAVSEGKRYFSSLVIDAALDYLAGSSVEPSSKLSHREMQIIQMIFHEKSPDDIASALFISKRTVDAHLAGIMSKLQVNTRLGIVLAALRNNIVNLDGEPVS
jgi:DNA-binding NarL/FixJ family response regulator